MKIRKILSRNRRDFHALYVCEHCEHEVERYGYDDDNFHENVIPNMECEKCGKTSVNCTPIATKYPADAVI